MEIPEVAAVIVVAADKAEVGAVTGVHPVDGLMVDLSEDHAVKAIDTSMAVLDEVTPGILRGEVDAATRGAEAARTISACCKDLINRIRSAGER